MNRFYFSFFLFLGTLHAGVDYTICIDGGGSKTFLQVLDEEGNILPLKQHEKEALSLIGAGSNINKGGLLSAKHALLSLFLGTTVEGKELLPLLPHCTVIAGLAGVGAPQNKEAVLAIFEELGIPLNQIQLMTDAEMALALLDGDGIILISGTGSVCLGKKNDRLFRVGGLGQILGDEGSGYKIGILSLQSALAEEYGFGPTTSLSPILKDFFQVTDLKKLIPLVNSQEISSAKIACLAPIVFEESFKGDLVAQEIVRQAAKDLSCLLQKMFSLSDFIESPVHLWGGVFKSPHTEAFLAEMLVNMPEQAKLTFINNANCNAATLFAQKNMF